LQHKQNSDVQRSAFVFSFGTSDLESSKQDSWGKRKLAPTSFAVNEILVEINEFLLGSGGARRDPEGSTRV
jgi:hypothetical protein